MTGTPLLLALHSSSETLGVALQPLGQPEAAVQVESFPLGRRLSNDLLPCVEQVLPAGDWPQIGRLAVATGAYVVPIAVTSARCWPRRSFSFIPGTIDVSIGPAVSAQDREPGELMDQVEMWIESEIRRVDPEAYRVIT